MSFISRFKGFFGMGADSPAAPQQLVAMGKGGGGQVVSGIMPNVLRPAPHGTDPDDLALAKWLLGYWHRADAFGFVCIAPPSYNQKHLEFILSDVAGPLWTDDELAKNIDLVTKWAAVQEKKKNINFQIINRSLTERNNAAVRDYIYNDKPLATAGVSEHMNAMAAANRQFLEIEKEISVAAAEIYAGGISKMIEAGRRVALLRLEDEQGSTEIFDDGKKKIHFQPSVHFLALCFLTLCVLRWPLRNFKLSGWLQPIVLDGPQSLNLWIPPAPTPEAISMSLGYKVHRPDDSGLTLTGDSRLERKIVPSGEQKMIQAGEKVAAERIARQPQVDRKNDLIANIQASAAKHKANQQAVEAQQEGSRQAQIEIEKVKAIDALRNPPAPVEQPAPEVKPEPPTEK